jgi:hypothetical protein
MELDLVRLPDRFFPDGIGAHVEEVVRDDVEAMVGAALENFPAQ